MKVSDTIHHPMGLDFTTAHVRRAAFMIDLASRDRCETDLENNTRVLTIAAISKLSQLLSGQVKVQVVYEWSQICTSTIFVIVTCVPKPPTRDQNPRQSDVDSTNIDIICLVLASKIGINTLNTLFASIDNSLRIHATSPTRGVPISQHRPFDETLCRRGTQRVKSERQLRTATALENCDSIWEGLEGREVFFGALRYSLADSQTAERSFTSWRVSPRWIGQCRVGRLHKIF